jgi:hypothetical protein
MKDGTEVTTDFTDKYDYSVASAKIRGEFTVPMLSGPIRANYMEELRVGFDQALEEKIVFYGFWRSQAEECTDTRQRRSSAGTL